MENPSTARTVLSLAHYFPDLTAFATRQNHRSLAALEKQQKKRKEAMCSSISLVIAMSGIGLP